MIKYKIKLVVLSWLIILFIEIWSKAQCTWYCHELNAFGGFYSIFNEWTLIYTLSSFLMVQVFIILTPYSLKKILIALSLLFLFFIFIDTFKQEISFNYLEYSIVKYLGNFVGLIISILILINKSEKKRKLFAINSLIIGILILVLYKIFN